MKNIIIVDTKENPATLKFINGANDEILLATNVLIGKNGVTSSKYEGDGKTPLGTFELGIAFGIHDRDDIKLDNSIEYITINENLYWIDDVHFGDVP